MYILYLHLKASIVCKEIKFQLPVLYSLKDQEIVNKSSKYAW